MSERIVLDEATERVLAAPVDMLERCLIEGCRYDKEPGEEAVCLDCGRPRVGPGIPIGTSPVGIAKATDPANRSDGTPFSMRDAFIPHEKPLDDKFSLVTTRDGRLYARETATRTVRRLVAKVRGKSARRGDKAVRRAEKEKAHGRS